MTCSFCDASLDQVQALVRRRDVTICDRCVNRAIATLLLAGETEPFNLMRNHTQELPRGEQ